MKKIETAKAPQTLGPYSQAIIAGGFVFCSGQLGIDPKTQILVIGGVKKETHQVMKNLEAVLKKAGCAFSSVVRCDIFLTNLADFEEVNKIYEPYFKDAVKPARQTVEVSKLPKGSSIEISCIAVHHE